jgi:nicotinamidase-related amidase
MSVYQVSLCGAITRSFTDGKRMVVLVIDEQGSDVEDEVLRNQIVVLEHARKLGIPVWLIELQPPDTPRVPTIPSLARYGSMVFSKPHLNAFDSRTTPNLNATLRLKGVSTLVVMGSKLNCCVQHTCVGGWPGRSTGRTYIPGACQLGFTVLTSSHVCHPFDHAPWRLEHSNLKFFTTV